MSRIDISNVLGAIALQSFILKNRARFYDITDRNEPYAPRDLAGYTDDGSYMFFRDALVEACGGVDPQLTLKYMRDLGVLDRDKNRLDKKVTIIGLGRPRLVVIKKKFIDIDLVGASGAPGKSK